MFANEEMSWSHDLTVDETSSTPRMTADLFERSAAATVDQEKREALLDYAKLFRKMVVIRAMQKWTTSRVGPPSASDQTREAHERGEAPPGFSDGASYAGPERG